MLIFCIVHVRQNAYFIETYLIVVQCLGETDGLPIFRKKSVDLVTYMLICDFSVQNPFATSSVIVCGRDLYCFVIVDCGRDLYCFKFSWVMHGFDNFPEKVLIF